MKFKVQFDQNFACDFLPLPSLFRRKKRRNFEISQCQMLKSLSCVISWKRAYLFFINLGSRVKNMFCPHPPLSSHVLIINPFFLIKWLSHTQTSGGNFFLSCISWESTSGGNFFLSCISWESELFSLCLLPNRQGMDRI